MGIASQLNAVLRELPAGVKLVAVSKTKPVADLMEAYMAGQRLFGENYVQELTDKQPQLPDDIEWHFIGHLQSNKVKYIAPFVGMIQGVDSFKLLKEIDKQAAKAGRTIRCLLQVHIAQEETKFGLDAAELEILLKSPELKALQHIRLCGLMGMASFTDNQAQVRAEFAALKQLFDRMKPLSPDPAAWTDLSMGMSGDYAMAIEEGATIVRVGSSIFGNRVKQEQ